MAGLEVIKIDFDNEATFAKKYHNDKIPLGSQLIVNQSQEAVFVNGGRVCDLFGPGTHSLTTANLPILSALINIPFGGRSPFSAEVWFINKVAKLDQPWGTTNPIVLDDPKTEVTMLIRAYGQWGFFIDDSRSFLTQLVGTLREFNSDMLNEYFRGTVLQSFAVALAEFAAEYQIPISQLSAHLDKVAEKAGAEIARQLDRFGIVLKGFQISSFNIEKRELEKIQDAQLNAYTIDKLSEKRATDTYKTVRQFDVLDKAVEKPGTAGDLLAAGLAIGGGLAAGAKAGKLFGDSETGMPEKGDIERRLKILKDLLDKGLITQDDYDKKKKSILEEI